MIHMNRRVLLGGAAVVIAAGGGALWWSRREPASQQTPVGPEPPSSGGLDLSKLNEPPAHGERPEGSETAKVTLIEYASASCPHCADFYLNVYPLLKKDYIDTGKVRFLLREFPHNDAGMGGFMVARCAPPEKYHAIIGALFKTQEKWVPRPLEGLKEIALQAGFTEESFIACTKNAEVAKAINAERVRAEGFGVDGIPYIFINGAKVEGEKSFEALKAIIDPLLG